MFDCILLILPVSHKFGFGLIDGHAMVDAALRWSLVPKQLTFRSRTQRPDMYVYTCIAG